MSLKLYESLKLILYGESVITAMIYGCALYRFLRLSRHVCGVTDNSAQATSYLSFFLVWSTSISWRLLASGCGRAGSAECITKCSAAEL